MQHETTLKTIIKIQKTMKKVFFALAVVAMFSFVACNGNNAETTDTTPAEEQVMEPAAEEMTCDSAAVEGLAEEATEEVVAE